MNPAGRCWKVADDNTRRVFPGDEVRLVLAQDLRDLAAPVALAKNVMTMTVHGFHFRHGMARMQPCISETSFPS
ncbi:MAG TPA: hypothetical protein VET87_18025 [Rubrivivax sp.]|nr:hypothetical protein [Rubrivivax sp.]